MYLMAQKGEGGGLVECTLVKFWFFLCHISMITRFERVLEARKGVGVFEAREGDDQVYNYTQTISRGVHVSELRCGR